MKEIWKDIENFDNYMISNFGNVKSKARYDSSGKRYLKEKYLKPGKLRHNHLMVILKGNDGLNHTMRVHRIVAMAFLNNPNNYPVINHKDENPSITAWIILSGVHTNTTLIMVLQQKDVLYREKNQQSS